MYPARPLSVSTSSMERDYPTVGVGRPRDLQTVIAPVEAKVTFEEDLV